MQNPQHSQLLSSQQPSGLARHPCVPQCLIPVLTDLPTAKTHLPAPEPPPPLPQSLQTPHEFTQAALAALQSIPTPASRQAPNAVAKSAERAITNLIAQCIAPNQLRSRFFSSPDKPFPDSDLWLRSAIVHDPNARGHPLETGPHDAVRPNRCLGIITVKYAVRNFAKLGIRLGMLRKRYLPGVPAPSVMCVIIRDKNPGKKSWFYSGASRFRSFDYTHPKRCPAFILFSHSGGNYEPYAPAIEAFIANLHTNIQPQYRDP